MSEIQIHYFREAAFCYHSFILFHPLPSMLRALKARSFSYGHERNLLSLSICAFSGVFAFILFYFILFYLILFYIYLLLRDRERQSMSMGGAEREETQNLKPAPSSELSAQSPTQGLNLQTARS